MTKRQRSASQAAPRKRRASTSSSSCSSSLESNSDSTSDASTGLMPPSRSPTLSSRSSPTDSNDKTISPQLPTSDQDSEGKEAPDLSSGNGYHTASATSPTILPSVAENLDHISAISSPQQHPPETFPIFQTGNVFIHCSLVEPVVQWQLHSAVLRRNSSWFRKIMHLSEEKTELSQAWLFFLLEEPGGFKFVLQGVNRIQEAVDCKHTLDVFNIKAEPTDDANMTGPATRPSAPINVAMQLSQAKEYTATIELYKQIFGVFYNQTIRIPLDPVNTTLIFCESITKIAVSLDCTHLTTAQLSTALQSHRQSLCHAIRTDPARWLTLSISLSNESIYIEALIHIIGAYPCWPWPTKRCTLPASILALVARKAEVLDQLCIEVERELLLLTIQVRSGPVQPQEHSQFDTWFVVQTFRDELAREFHGLEISKSRSLRRGHVFRKIRVGGSAYMAYEEMRRMMQRIMPSAVENLEEDLGMLKEYASEIVEEVTKNECMLDVNAQGSGVGYLTCVKVGKEDIPWIASSEG